MPTIHVRLLNQETSLSITGMSGARIDSIRLTRYAVSATAVFASTAIAVELPWVTTGIHTSNTGSNHLMYLPVDPTAQYNSEEMNIDMVLNSPYIPQSSQVGIYTADLAPANIAGLEINLWFDYIPVY